MLHNSCLNDSALSVSRKRARPPSAKWLTEKMGLSLSLECQNWGGGPGLWRQTVPRPRGSHRKRTVTEGGPTSWRHQHQQCSAIHCIAEKYAVTLWDARQHTQVAGDCSYHSCYELNYSAVAVCAERHRTADHWHATPRSHHTGTARTSLAAHPRACEVLSGMSRSPVAVWAGASLPGRWLLPRVRQHSALSTVSWHSDLHGAKNIQQLRRQNFCSRWTPLVELSSGPAAQSRH